MRFKTRRSIQMAGGAVLLVGSLFLTGTGAAHAASICRTDPVITLSNGYVISLVDAVPTSSNITSVNYALHVPKGVTLSKITFDAYYSVEHVTVTGDQTVTHYQVVTTTTTTKAGAAFTAYVYHGTTTLGSATGKSNGSATISWIGQ